MRIFIDTNILISSFVFNGKISNLIQKLLNVNCEIYVSEYVESEFENILNSKWPEKAQDICNELHSMPFTFCHSTTEILGNLRDEKDIPVLSDAIFNNADIILTGDKDFLESNLEYPKICSPTMMEEFLINLSI